MHTQNRYWHLGFEYEKIWDRSSDTRGHEEILGVGWMGGGSVSEICRLSSKCGNHCLKIPKMYKMDNVNHKFFSKIVKINLGIVSF